ncbi:hypothetical protein GQ53DRAFT_816083 [Thozetella sp. PMI_491]|nr:hypothetical protein GQ53DRAFT_816083 [Thozetella sp. PMI_491]
MPTWKETARDSTATMLEYFAYKKFKKNKAAKVDKAEESAKAEVAAFSPHEPSRVISTPKPPPVNFPEDDETPVLDDDDERFLEQLTASAPSHNGNDEDDGVKPPLPPRVKTPDLTWDSDSESFIALKGTNDKGKGKEVEKFKEKDGKGLFAKQANRLSIYLRRDKDKEKKKETKEGLKPHADHLAVAEPEVDREKDDLTRVLDDLNLSARNNKAFSLSAESTELVQKFTVVLKDLVNGVPTAVNDLTSLLDDKDGKLAGNYEKLPKSMKKLVTQLPDKLSTTLAPEILAVAAEAQGLTAAEAAASGGLKGAAKRMLLPKSLSDLVTKPGAVVGMLKAIMNALKLRWPAFIGTNVIWSVALFLLLFVLWYCHKRGREVRLEREGQDKPIDGSSRIEELPDDPTLPEPPAAGSDRLERQTPIIIETPTEETSSGPSLPRPPIGPDRQSSR